MDAITVWHYRRAAFMAQAQGLSETSNKDSHAYIEAPKISWQEEHIFSILLTK